MIWCLCLYMILMHAWAQEQVTKASHAEISLSLRRLAPEAAVFLSITSALHGLSAPF
jgi:hypothetical protein